MPASTQSPPEPTSQILDAAAEVFAEAGYAGARVDEIAHRAGVNKAMLYYHVGDKAALYSAVLSRAFAHIRATLDEALAAKSDPEERFAALVRTIAGMASQLPHHPRMMLREVAAGGGNLPDDVVRQMAGILDLARAVLTEGARTGALRPVNPVLTHLMVLGTVTFMTASRPLRERLAGLGRPASVPDRPQELADFLVDVLLHGIAAPGGAR